MKRARNIATVPNGADHVVFDITEIVHQHCLGWPTLSILSVFYTFIRYKLSVVHIIIVCVMLLHWP